jgi:glucose-6-phosphate 1-dehydrogenase
MTRGQSSFRVKAFSEEGQAEPTVFVMFGATGDLTARKIAPALYNLAIEGRIHERTVVLGVARRERPDEQFRDEMLQAIRDHGRGEVDEDYWNEFSKRWFYHITHVDEPGEYETLRDRVNELDEQFDCGGNRLFYLAMSPEQFATICGHLGEVGLNRPPSDEAYVRLVVEKPFGRDLESASRLNDDLHRYFDESQIYRIDHYLGKETVQNILVTRFANSIFEPLLRRELVDNIQITTAEKVGMEGRRGPFYESVGAMRDMMQNHMLQLLALLTMDPPADTDAESIRDEKVKLLRSLRCKRHGEACRGVVIGQYAGGDQEDMPAYRQEKGVDENSTVETFAALKLYIDNWRWADVPIYMRTGKRLPEKISEVVVEFRREPINLFQEFGCDMGGASHLHFRIAPREGISVSFDAKVPGTKMLLRPVSMDFYYDSTFSSATPEAYEHLILDAMQGDPTLFIRGDEVEAGWRFIDSIRRHLGEPEGPKLHFYKPGTWGPEQADELFEDPYKRWHLIQAKVE